MRSGVASSRSDFDAESSLGLLASPLCGRLAVIRIPLDDGYGDRLTVQSIGGLQS